jgi:hypothetical protein
MHFTFHNSHTSTVVSASPHRLWLSLASSASSTTILMMSCVKFLPWSIRDQWASGIYRLQCVDGPCTCLHCARTALQQAAGPHVNKE